LKLKYDPPFIIKQVFPDFVWESKGERILLTFDDGPVPGVTDAILRKLEELKIKAMFFCVGNNIAKNPSLAREIILQGHLIGNHTFNHQRITSSGFDVHREIDLFNEIVAEKLGIEARYFRPPHGRFNLSTTKLLKNRNMINVMWSLLTYDFNGNLSLVKYSVVNYLKKNSIIVLHDSLKSRDIIIDSISFIADEADARGLRLGGPDECLK
jgi:peptidoglycan-N-acetylglucosamine deacetylase